MQRPLDKGQQDGSVWLPPAGEESLEGWVAGPAAMEAPDLLFMIF